MADDDSECSNDKINAPTQTSDTFALTPLGETKITIRKIKRTGKCSSTPSTSKQIKPETPTRKSISAPSTSKSISKQIIRPDQAEKIEPKKRRYNQDCQDAKDMNIITTVEENTSGASTSKKFSSNLSTTKSCKPKTSDPKTKNSKASFLKEATLERPTTSKNISVASTSTASPTKEPLSKKSSPEEPSGIEDPDFWLRALRSNYNTNEFKEKLMNNNAFTEDQADILQKSFYLISRKMNNVLKNNERIRKTHACRACEFSISHQCIPYDSIRGDMTLLDSIITHNDITSDHTVICTFCTFAFSHRHKKIVEQKPRLSDCLREISSDLSISCSICYLNIEIKQRFRDPCYEIRRWSSLCNDSKSHRAKFQRSLETAIQERGMKKLSVDDLYACDNNCCLLFHRCDENTTEGSVP